MSKNVLIAGGSGAIGTALTEMLLLNNYKVSWLSTKNIARKNVPVFHWDYQKKIIDENCFEGITAIINLAGAGIADKRWSKKRKKELKESRIKTTDLLLNKITEFSININAFISASAIGYYGYDSGSIEKKEGSRFGDDFLATLTKEWEAATEGFAGKGIRTVRLRTGIVLQNGNGAWPKLARVIKTGFGAALGSGDQFMSWIHINDLCRIYKWAIENDKADGVYNAVTPNPVTNKEFTKETALILKKPLFMPNVPGFILRIMYGELASVLLGSSRVSSEKIVKEGFNFEYNELREALKSLSEGS